MKDNKTISQFARQKRQDLRELTQKIFIYNMCICPGGGTVDTSVSGADAFNGCRSSNLLPGNNQTKNFSFV